MKLSDWLEKVNLTSLKFTAPFLQLEFMPQDEDKDAAWELYVELLTRITTQPLSNETGIEITALESVHSLFPTTRSILKNKGRKCIEFTKLAIVVLNQIVRPFTAKWHRLSNNDGFADADVCMQFRKELAELQWKLVIYTKALADLAGVEDLTSLNNSGE